jgi:hypothetical protein
VFLRNDGRDQRMQGEVARWRPASRIQLEAACAFRFSRPRIHIEPLMK